MMVVGASFGSEFPLRSLAGTAGLSPRSRERSSHGAAAARQRPRRLAALDATARRRIGVTLLVRRAAASSPRLWTGLRSALHCCVRDGALDRSHAAAAGRCWRRFRSTARLLPLLAVAYRDISPWTLPLFFVPALAAQRCSCSIRISGDSRGHSERQRAASSGEPLLRQGAGRDARCARSLHGGPFRRGRDLRARHRRAGWGSRTNSSELAHLCGLVHDIGKIGLPAGLLEKPGALTLEERREMQRHSEIGERILANVDTYAEIAAIVRHHHERVDGQGYPDGLTGERFPCCPGSSRSLMHTTR